MTRATNLVVSIGEQVVALSMDSGEPRWRYTMPKTSSSPRLLIHDRYVIVAGPVLACLDYETGGVYWQVPRPARHNYAGTLLLSEGRVLYALKSNVYCYAFADGSLLWTAPIASGWAMFALGTPGNVVQACHK